MSLDEEEHVFGKSYKRFQDVNGEEAVDEEELEGIDQAELEVTCFTTAQRRIQIDGRPTCGLKLKAQRC